MFNRRSFHVFARPWVAVAALSLAAAGSAYALEAHHPTTTHDASSLAPREQLEAFYTPPAIVLPHPFGWDSDPHVMHMAEMFVFGKAPHHALHAQLTAADCGGSWHSLAAGPSGRQVRALCEPPADSLVTSMSAHLARAKPDMSASKEHLVAPRVDHEHLRGGGATATPSELRPAPTGNPAG